MIKSSPLPSGEYVEFRDPADATHRWRFDVQFFASGYQCVFGCGCHGAEDERRVGTCCEYGVVLNDTDDAEKLERAVGLMKDDEWELRRKRYLKKKGDPHTRAIDGGCIFHNRGDANGVGAGCSLHSAALARGEDPMDWKPEICSIVPIFKEIHEDERLTIVRAFQHLDWNDDDPQIEVLRWWCVDSPIAYTGQNPVYKAMARELAHSIPDGVYEPFVAYMDDYMKRHEIGRQPVNFTGLGDHTPTGVSGSFPITLPMAT